MFSSVVDIINKNFLILLVSFWWPGLDSKVAVFVHLLMNQVLTLRGACLRIAANKWLT